MRILPKADICAKTSCFDHRVQSSSDIDLKWEKIRFVYRELRAAEERASKNCSFEPCLSISSKPSGSSGALARKEDVAQEHSILK